MILLLSAVAAEQALLEETLDNAETLRCGHLSVRRGELAGKPVLMCATGIGKSAAAAATALLLHQFPVTLVYVLGCAGAFPASGLQVGDLAIASVEIHGDEGVCTPGGFLAMSELGLPPELATAERFPTTALLLSRIGAHLHSYALSNAIHCLSGPFVTVSTCSGSTQRAVQLQRRTGAIAENMEGAAVAQLCHAYHTPFLEIRAISNMVEDRDLSRWQLAAAMRRAQLATLALLQQQDLWEMD